MCPAYVSGQTHGCVASVLNQASGKQVRLQLVREGQSLPIDCRTGLGVRDIREEIYQFCKHRDMYRSAPIPPTRLQRVILSWVVECDVWGVLRVQRTRAALSREASRTARERVPDQRVHSRRCCLGARGGVRSDGRTLAWNCPPAPVSARSTSLDGVVASTQRRTTVHFAALDAPRLCSQQLPSPSMSAPASSSLPSVFGSQVSDGAYVGVGSALERRAGFDVGVAALAESRARKALPTRAHPPLRRAHRQVSARAYIASQDGKTCLDTA